MILGKVSVYLTWDIGHDAASEYRDKEVILENKDKIKHMHLHDANGDKNHLPLYKGKVNIHESIVFAVKHNLSIVIETKTAAGLDESVRMIKEHVLIE